MAFQIEWNKLRVHQRTAGWPVPGYPSSAEFAQALGGPEEDWERLREAWGRRFYGRLALNAEGAHGDPRADARRHPGRLRAHDASLVATLQDRLAAEGHTTARSTS